MLTECRDPGDSALAFAVLEEVTECRDLHFGQTVSVGLSDTLIQ